MFGNFLLILKLKKKIPPVSYWVDIKWLIVFNWGITHKIIIPWCFCFVFCIRSNLGQKLTLVMNPQLNVKTVLQLREASYRWGEQAGFRVSARAGIAHCGCLIKRKLCFLLLLGNCALGRWSAYIFCARIEGNWNTTFVCFFFGREKNFDCMIPANWLDKLYRTVVWCVNNRLWKLSSIFPLLYDAVCVKKKN